MKEAYRDRRGLPWVDVLRQDVAYAGRQLRQRPGLAMTAILTLGLSMAAAIAVFTVVNDVLFRPLTYPDAHGSSSRTRDWRSLDASRSAMPSFACGAPR